VSWRTGLVLLLAAGGLCGGDPDGRWIYATSESAMGAVTAQAAGTVTVIGLREAETRPADAVAGTVPAGCSPVQTASARKGRQRTWPS
jgi:hypothetical protein